MTGEWPPDGYSPPKEYKSSDKWMLAIGLVLILPVLELTRAKVAAGASLVVKWSGHVGETVGLADHPMLFLTVALLTAVCWILASGAIIITLHEGIHFVLGTVLDVNPRFEFHNQLFLPNPSVVAYCEGIGRNDNIVMLSGPFVLLSLFCASVMWMTSGIVAATAAIMFAINAVPSCGDIYHVGRIAMMPRGTLFANFDEEDGLRTEVITPESSPRPG